MGIMRKFGQSGSFASSASPDAARPIPVAPPSEPAPEIKPALEPFIEAIIANGLVFKGVVSGASSLLIDGEVVGNIDLPNSRVTVGLTGCVSDGLSICIRAREIVVMGKVRGNISATDLVDIQSEGSLTGNVNAARISIADGAFFKGDINLHTPQPKPAVSVMRETKEMKVYA